ncbi:uncharacterized protein LOC126788828 [Argentina anserina]|uniref:uncharacterized protein LOC126788828 n=1 Tax=Argentina anserina TaxID=57926 RepID=UPI0021764091|nr:uncharacterized protein LOC126788828 [Potentilla anserina]
MVNLKMTTKYGAMASAVCASIFVAGFYFVRERYQRKEPPPKLMRSMSMAVLHGGKLALKRLVEYHEARADKDALHQAECDLKAHLFTKKHPDYKKLQSIVAKLEMSGKEAEGADILEKTTVKLRNERKVHERYETEMLLVEMLIYKGDYKKALSCDCLRHVEISDARRPLYKAVIYIMLSKYPREEIIDEWKKFHDLNQSFHCEPMENESLVEAQLHKLIIDFNEFEKVINVLKEDIIDAQAMKRKK